jgi:outer membrane protein assembly factor BamB
MSDALPRAKGRLSPALAWTVLTDAPLQGLALAREAGRIFAWDEASNLYLLDLHGQRWSAGKAPGRILAGASSDNGALIALLGEGPRLWLLSADLEPIADRPTLAEAAALAVDPHGRYVAVGSRLGQAQFYTRHGQPAGRFESKQPLAHFCFVPDRPVLIAAAMYGTIQAVKLYPGGSGGRLEAEIGWQQSLLSNVGRLTTTGSGGMVLASCFTHGVQRYDVRGRNEGSYHLGGSAAHAVPDYAGRTIAVATLEGELAILNSAGNIRWRSSLPRPAIALECDALGRFLIYGLGTGELSRLDLDDSAPAREPAAPQVIAVPGAGRGGLVRSPDWIAPVAQTDEQAETAVLTVLDEPPRIGFLTGKNRLQVFTPDGRHLGQGPELLGVGRLLRTAPGWIAAATDRNVALFDARRNTMHRLDVSLVELTHLAIRPESFGVLLVQERDRIGRATVAGDWIWKKELKAPIEDIAIGPRGCAALTTEDGLLWIFDPRGEPLGSFTTASREPLGLVEAPRGAPEPVTWLSLACRAERLRAHDPTGRVVWEQSLPWEAWQLYLIDTLVVAAAPDGRAVAFDGSGQLRGQSSAAEPRSLFAPSPTGEVWRIVHQGVHLICTELDGPIAWRAVTDAPIGPIAAGQPGVAVLIGRSLAWFGTTPTRPAGDETPGIPNPPA